MCIQWTCFNIIWLFQDKILSFFEKCDKNLKKMTYKSKNKKVIIDHDRTRTCNPQIRSLVPYPLGHMVSLYQIDDNFLNNKSVFQSMLQYNIKNIIKCLWTLTLILCFKIEVFDQQFLPTCAMILFSFVFC